MVNKGKCNSLSRLIEIWPNLKFFYHLDTFYSSKKVLKRTLLRTIALVFTLALFCVCFDCRFNSSQLLLIPFWPLILDFWKVKGLVNAPKLNQWAKVKPFQSYNCSVITNLGINTYNMHTTLLGWIVQHGAWSKLTCIFSNYPHKQVSQDLTEKKQGSRENPQLG